MLSPIKLPSKWKAQGHFIVLLLLHTCQAAFVPSSRLFPETRTRVRAASVDTNTAEKPWCIHPIDYSAANEFIAEHYRHVYKDGVYFENGADSGHFDEENHSDNKPMEPVYNARQGVLLAGAEDSADASLRTHGFTLVQSPTQVTDWNNLQQIQSLYLDELREMIHSQIDPNMEHLSHVVFWNPMLRGEQQQVSNVERDMNNPHPPTSPTAGMVHIDQDVGAYDTVGFVGLIQNNCIDPAGDANFTEINQMINQGHRFAIWNFWRNADFDAPIRRQPLAVFSTSYTSDMSTYFPNAQPHPTQSRWYTFPEMTADEVLIFKQYDRDGRLPSDVWHCALKSIADETAPPRQSFDIRALLVFHEHPPVESDRYSAHRIRPVLNYEESGEFCDKQAEKRQHAKKAT